MRYDDFRDKLELNTKGNIGGRFKAIKISDYYLSIQASYGHYCTPRLTLENIYHYETMEIAIIKDNEMIEEDEVLSYFDRYEELKGYCVGAVFAYVPINLIQILYNYLKLHEKEKEILELIEKTRSNLSSKKIFNNLYIYEDNNELGIQKLVNRLQQIEIESLKTELNQLKRTIDNQDEDIMCLLDEIEENEEDIETYQEWVRQQSRALIDKDKYIEQLEGCILNQREEVKHLQDEIGGNVEETEYLEEHIEHLEELVEQLTKEVMDLERLISVHNKSLIAQEKEIDQLEEDLRNSKRIGSLIHHLEQIDWDNNPSFRNMVLGIMFKNK